MRESTSISLLGALGVLSVVGCVLLVGWLVQVGRMKPTSRTPQFEALPRGGLTVGWPEDSASVDEIEAANLDAYLRRRDLRDDVSPVSTAP